MFTGHHIDLSKILSISEAKRENNSFCFDIHFQLRDSPVVYWIDPYDYPKLFAGLVEALGADSDDWWERRNAKVIEVLNQYIATLIAKWKDYNDLK